MGFTTTLCRRRLPEDCWLGKGTSGEEVYLKVVQNFSRWEFNRCERLAFTSFLRSLLLGRNLDGSITRGAGGGRKEPLTSSLGSGRGGRWFVLL